MNRNKGKITKAQLSDGLIEFIEGSKTNVANYTNASYSAINTRQKPQVMYKTSGLEVDDSTDIIAIEISDFVKGKDLLLVHKNGILLQEMSDYIISDDNMYILNLDGYWSKDDKFNFTVINGDSNYYVESLENKIATLQRQISSITKVLLNIQTRIK